MWCKSRKESIQGAAANVALRRRLSDKDKERRLVSTNSLFIKHLKLDVLQVRRSSSKRKDKENGGSEGSKNGTHVRL